MADKSDYTAKIRAKGLSSTGVTEDLAKQFYHQLGSNHLFIVEGRVDRRSENGDGTHTADLILLQVEPSTAQFVDDHLRELMRAMARNRALNDGAIPETLGTTPDLQDVVKGSGEAILTRDEEGNATGIWDGNTDDAPGGRCGIKGCVLPPFHDGDHDPFAAATEVYPAGHPNAGMRVETPEEPHGDDEPAAALRSVPDPFTAE